MIKTKSTKSALQLLLLIYLAINGLLSSAQTINAAGFAFIGDFSDAQLKFPYSTAVLKQYTAENKEANSGSCDFTCAYSQKINRFSQENIENNKKHTFNFSALSELKNSDQALVISLVLTNENVIIEKFKNYYKIFVNIQAEALLFDFKALMVVRSYPIAINYFDAQSTEPTDNDITKIVRDILLSEEDKRLPSEYVKKLSKITIPKPGTKFITVKSASANDELISQIFPQKLANPKAASQLIADTFSATLSDRLGVPVIPSRISHSTGVMRVRFADFDSFTLKLPEADYWFEISLDKAIKKVYKKQERVLTVFLYGVFTNLTFSSEINRFMSGTLKNGEFVKVPASRETINDDFPHFNSAMKSLFVKLFDAMLKDNYDWVNKAAEGGMNDEQVKKTYEALRSAM